MTLKTSNSNDNKGKVGSDREAAAKVGGKADFGNPVHPGTVVRENEDGVIDRPAGSALGAGANPGRRTAGVGSTGDSEGESSGGDLDTDFVGVAGGAGLSPSHPQTM